jgi:hypothetical protein
MAPPLQSAAAPAGLQRPPRPCSCSSSPPPRCGSHLRIPERGTLPRVSEGRCPRLCWRWPAQAWPTDGWMPTQRLRQAWACRADNSTQVSCHCIATKCNDFAVATLGNRHCHPSNAVRSTHKVPVPIFSALMQVIPGCCYKTTEVHRRACNTAERTGYARGALSATLTQAEREPRREQERAVQGWTLQAQPRSPGAGEVPLVPASAVLGRNRP